MKKFLILKYILMYLPFITGITLYSFGVYNIVSSLLFFLGGYISIKHTLDIRQVKKNTSNIPQVPSITKVPVKVVRNKNIVYPIKIKKMPRVRKRIKQ